MFMLQPKSEQAANLATADSITAGEAERMTFNEFGEADGSTFHEYVEVVCQGKATRFWKSNGPVRLVTEAEVMATIIAPVLGIAKAQPEIRARAELQA